MHPWVKTNKILRIFEDELLFAKNKINICTQVNYVCLDKKEIDTDSKQGIKPLRYMNFI